MTIADHCTPARPRCALTLPAFGLALLALTACEDPARPFPPGVDATLLVDSDPRGGSIFIDGNATGEVTPAIIDQLEAGARGVIVRLDTGGVTYSWTTVVRVAPDTEAIAAGPLTVRCLAPSCLRDAAGFHSAGNLRFAVNAAGPLFLYDGRDLGIVWPSATSNSYASIGAATLTALVDGEPVALGLRNVGNASNYWSGRPVHAVTGTSPYEVRVPSWIAPPAGARTTVRGIEIVHEVLVDADMPDVLDIRVTWRNISADSLYRLLDPSVPVAGITYTDAYLGFILDPDVGAFAEAEDDMVSYDVMRKLVYAYDAAFQVPGFSGGWSDRPGLIGLMLVDGVGDLVRLNAWPDASDFAAGSTEDEGRLLLTGAQTSPSNHPDPRIGFAPDRAPENYIVSVASGPVTLAPGDSATARFAVLLAAPVPGSFASGQIVAAGDPVDATRPLAATAATLIELADSVLGPATFTDHRD